MKGKEKEKRREPGVDKKAGKPTGLAEAFLTGVFGVCLISRR